MCHLRSNRNQVKSGRGTSANDERRGSQAELAHQRQRMCGHEVCVFMPSLVSLLPWMVSAPLGPRVKRSSF